MWLIFFYRFGGFVFFSSGIVACIIDVVIMGSSGV